MHYLKEYFAAVYDDWLSFMTGALSIVFAITCLFVNENRKLRQILLFLAIVAFIVAAEDVWKMQFIRAETLLFEAQKAEATNILQSVEFQGMQLDSRTPQSIFIPRQPIVSRIDLWNQGPHRAEDFSPNFAIDIVRSSDDEDARWASFEVGALKAQSTMKRIWDFGVGDPNAYVAAQFAPLDYEMVYGLQSGRMRLYTYFFATWHQGNQFYRQESCRYLDPPGDQNRAVLCKGHNTTRMVNGPAGEKRGV